jgi:protein SCO1/2
MRVRISDLLTFSSDESNQETDFASRKGEQTPLKFSRRSFLQAAVSTVPFFRDHGRIRPPVPIPDVKLVRHDAASTTLTELATGHVTAVQLMFTECTTTCPIQAAIFQHVQRLLPNMASNGLQLLSLSVNPTADSPKALSKCLLRFHAGPGWIAATPSVKDGPIIQNFFGKPDGAYSDHSTQVNIVDRQARLVWRTMELPTAEEIAAILQRV